MFENQFSPPLLVWVPSSFSHSKSDVRDPITFSLVKYTFFCFGMSFYVVGLWLSSSFFSFDKSLEEYSNIFYKKDQTNKTLIRPSMLIDFNVYMFSYVTIDTWVYWHFRHKLLNLIFICIKSKLLRVLICLMTQWDAIPINMFN